MRPPDPAVRACRRLGAGGVSRQAAFCLFCQLSRQYRVIDRDGNLVDAMLSEHRDMQAAKAFFRSARAIMGYKPERVATDGHGFYPRAIRTVLGRRVRHCTSAYLNNRIEQDHRRIKARL